MERAASSIIPRAVTHLGSSTTSCGSRAVLPRLSKMLGSAPPSRSVEHPTCGRDRRRAFGWCGRPRPAVHIGFVFVSKHRRYDAAIRQVPANFQNDTSRNLEFGDRPAIYSLALSGRQGPSVWRTIEANQLQLFQFSPHPFQTLVGRLCG